jgi:hypothetical protein
VDERSIEVFVFCPFKNGTVNVPKLPCIGGVDIVEMQPTQNGSQTPDTAQIEDILQMAAQMVDIQPLKRALGGNIYLELTEW